MKKAHTLLSKYSERIRNLKTLDSMIKSVDSTFNSLQTCSFLYTTHYSCQIIFLPATIRSCFRALSPHVPPEAHIQALKDGCYSGHFELPWQSAGHKTLKAKFAPATAAQWEVICSVWLWVAAGGRRQSGKAAKEERDGGRNERGLNQCHPLELTAKEDRCSLYLFVCVCVCTCVYTCTHISQELFCFKSIH